MQDTIQLLSRSLTNQVENLDDGQRIAKIMSNYAKGLDLLDNFDHKTLDTKGKTVKNAVIIDSLGVFKTNKYVAGVDFKLPLDTTSLAFLYEDCLNDATSDSKNLISKVWISLLLDDVFVFMLLLELLPEAFCNKFKMLFKVSSSINTPY